MEDNENFNEKNKRKKDHKSDFSKKSSQKRNEHRDSLDIQSIQYYQRILNMINKDFETTEEKGITSSCSFLVNFSLVYSKFHNIVSMIYFLFIQKFLYKTFLVNSKKMF